MEEVAVVGYKVLDAPFLLYWGSHKQSSHKAVLKRMKINRILLLGDNVEEKFQKAQASKALEFDYLVINLSDSNDASIIPLLDRTNEFIEKSDDFGTFVACPDGTSSSVAICMAYLIKTMHLEVYDAYNHLSKVWDHINPNKGFMVQLQEYYDSLHPRAIQYRRSFSILQFNMLADYCATKKNFPYCISEDILKFPKRAKQILDHLIKLQADILCFQELDRFDWFNSKLSELGYTGVFHKRPGGDKPDGCGTFLKSELFQLEGSWVVEFKDKTRRIAQFMKISLKKPIIRGKKDRDNTFLLCNTHLYWDTTQPNIQLQQIQTILQTIKPFYNDPKDSQLFATFICGDFNSSPEQYPFLYLSNNLNATTQQHPTFNTETRNNFPPFKSAYSNYHNGTHPPFTAYQDKWNGCVDYIWYTGREEDLGVIEVMPLPSKAEVTSEVALPNSQFPSDHLMIMATFGC